MSTKRRMISLITLLLTVSIGIVTNAVSDSFPNDWLPYLKYSPAALVVLIIIFFAISEIQEYIEKQDREKAQEDAATAEIRINQDEALTEPNLDERLEVQLLKSEVDYQQSAMPLHEPLTWPRLKKICKEISRSGVARIEIHYDRNLYFRREGLVEEFEKFINSEQIGFVLTGSSGVGKSQFLMWLYDSYQVEHENVCCLIYDATILPTSAFPLVVHISYDFQRSLAFNQPIDILNEIGRIPGIDGCKVILCIDAVNENPKPVLLLKQIDRLIRSAHYRWLKVVVTAKPEAWRLLTNLVNIGAAKYYRLNQPVIPSRPDFSSVSYDLKPFRIEELPLVYSNFREKFNLEISYDDLSDEERVIYSEPLTLFLISSIRKVGKIPDNLDARQIIKVYIEYLISEPVKQRRLEPEDLEYLQQRLLPLMIGKFPIVNRITAERIAEAAHTGPHQYQPLWDFIRFGNRDKDRERNIAFIRLVDANILSHRGLGSDFEIFFTYERYWDYFGGLRLYELYKEDPNAVKGFGELLSEVRRAPFLWGIVEHALYYFLQNQQTDLMAKLAESNHEDCRNMVAVVLIRFARQNDEYVHKILLALLNNFKMPVLSKSVMNKSMVAIEVASNIGDLDILKQTLACNHLAIQDRSILKVCEMWTSNQQAVLQLLEWLISQITLGRLLFRQSYLTSAVFLSVLISTMHFRDIDRSSQQIIAIWKRNLKRILLHQPGKKSWYERPVKGIRDRVLIFSINLLVKLLRNFPSRYLVINLGELKEYYKLPKSVRQMALDFVPFLNVNYGDFEALNQRIEALFNQTVNQSLLNNMLIKLLIDYALVAQALRSGRQIIELTLEYAFREINRPELSKRIMWDKGWVFAALAILEQEEISDRLFEQYSGYFFDCFTKVESWRGARREYALLGYSDYIIIYYKKHKNFDVQLIRDLMEWAIAHQHYQKISDLLEEMGYIIGSDYWKAVLYVIEPTLRFLKKEPLHTPEKLIKQEEEIVKSLLELLSVSYFNHPIELSAYLGKNSIPKETIDQIRVTKMNDRLAGDLIKGGVGAWGQFEIMYSFSAEGQPIMIWAFRTALSSKNLSQFLIRISKKVLNMLLEDHVFSLDE
jgi:hypothetical protein